MRDAARQGKAGRIGRSHLGDIGNIGTALLEVGDVDRHHLVDALGPAGSEREADPGTHGLAHCRGAVYPKRVHDLDHTARIVLDPGLALYMIGMAMARIVNGNGPEVRRQRL